MPDRRKTTIFAPNMVGIKEPQSQQTTLFTFRVATNAEPELTWVGVSVRHGDDEAMQSIETTVLDGMIALCRGAR